MTMLKSKSLFLNTNEEVLNSNKTLNLGDSQVQFLDPDGADRDVFLPLIHIGLIFYVYNTGSDNDLVVKNNDGSQVLLTISPNRVGFFICKNSSSWEIALMPQEEITMVKATERQTTNFQTSPFKRYKLAQNVEAILPQNPADNDWIMFASLENLEEEAATIKRYAGTAYKIMGKQEDLLYSSNIPFTLMYDSVYDDWRFA